VVVAPEGKPEVIKILHLNAGNMIGGVESVLLTFAEFAGTCPQLQQEFALAFDGAFADALRRAGTVVSILPEAQLRSPVSVLRTRDALRKLIQRQRYDAIVSHAPWCQVVYAPVAKRMKIPVVFWMHNVADGHWLQRIAARHSPKLTICNSAFTRSTLPGLYPYSPSRIVYNPVRPLEESGANRKEARSGLGATDDTLVIFMASRMDSWKGHVNLLRAVAEIPTAVAWQIWIAGAPQSSAEKAYFEDVQSEAKRLKLGERVRFLGHRSDVPVLMKAADIYCQPNAEPEPFGVVFVEALQAGVPVVTFSMGGPQEILDAKTGILVPPGDLAALRDALVRLMEDAPLRLGLGSSGPERARELCDPARQILRLHEVVLPVCKEPNV